MPTIGAGPYSPAARAGRAEIAQPLRIAPFWQCYDKDSQEGIVIGNTGYGAAIAVVLWAPELPLKERQAVRSRYAWAGSASAAAAALLAVSACAGGGSTSSRCCGGSACRPSARRLLRFR